MFGLPAENLDRPVVGIVSRFVDQKGFDLIAAVADELLAEDLAITAVGTGQPEYEALFEQLAARYPDARRRENRIRQCGGAQDRSGRGHVSDAVALRTVRAEPDLQPAVWHGAHRSGHGWARRHGAKFRCRARNRVRDSNSKSTMEPALLECVRTALATYRDAAAWRAVQTNGMAKDFSWKASAASYVTLYEAAKRSRIPRVARTSKV